MTPQRQGKEERGNPGRWTRTGTPARTEDQTASQEPEEMGQGFEGNEMTSCDDWVSWMVRPQRAAGERLAAVNTRRGLPWAAHQVRTNRSNPVGQHPVAGTQPAGSTASSRATAQKAGAPGRRWRDPSKAICCIGRARRKKKRPLPPQRYRPSFPAPRPA